MIAAFCRALAISPGLFGLGDIETACSHLGILAVGAKGGSQRLAAISRSPTTRSLPDRTLPVRFEDVEGDRAIGKLQTVVSPALRATVSLFASGLAGGERRDAPFERKGDWTCARPDAKGICREDGVAAEKERSERNSGFHAGRAVEGVTANSVGSLSRRWKERARSGREGWRAGRVKATEKRGLSRGPAGTREGGAAAGQRRSDRAIDRRAVPVRTRCAGPPRTPKRRRGAAPGYIRRQGTTKGTRTVDVSHVPTPKPVPEGARQAHAKPSRGQPPRLLALMKRWKSGPSQRFDAFCKRRRGGESDSVPCEGTVAVGKRREGKTGLDTATLPDLVSAPILCQARNARRGPSYCALQRRCSEPTEQVK